MSKWQRTVLGIGLVVVLTVVAILYYFFHPNSLDRRLRNHKRHLIQLRGEDSKCFSVQDCRMLQLSHRQCSPVDYLFSYSRRSQDVKAIQKEQAQFEKLFAQRFPQHQNPGCEQTKNLQLRCIEGQCVLRIFEQRGP